MNSFKEIAYKNSTQDKITIILEPRAEEYFVHPGERVNIVIRGGGARGHLEIEHTSDALVIYGWEGTVISLMQDGNELIPNS